MTLVPDPIASRDAVARAWRRVEGRRALAKDAPFDAPNPLSLRRLQILYHIEAALGRSLPAEPFRTARRPSDFCRALQTIETPARPSVFLLPGLGGDDPWLMLFRSRLPASVRMATISYPDWPERNLLDYDFAALVSFVTDEITRLAPDGPLRLAGYSLGGHLVYAAALELVARGRTVACVGVLDSAWASVPHATPVFSLQPLRHFIAMARRGEALPSLAHFVTKCMMKVPSLVARIAPLRLRLPLDFGFHLRRALIMELHLRELAPWLDRVLRDPKELKAELILFRSEDHAPCEAFDLGWGQCCQQVRVIPVVGGHHGMFAPETFRSTFIESMGL